MQTSLQTWEELTGKLVDLKIVDGYTDVVVKVERIIKIRMPLESIVLRGVPYCKDDGRGVSILRTSSEYIVRLSEGTVNYLTEKFQGFRRAIAE